MKTMRILMLGDAGTGKTTFMMATYGLMAEEGIQGFSVESNDKTQHRQLMQAFRRFIDAGEYPPPTVRMDSYEYTFYIDDMGVMEFILTDMRGESIYSPDTARLRREIANSDAILLFLNGLDVLTGKDLEQSLFNLLSMINSSVTLGKQLLFMPIYTHMDLARDIDDELLEQLIEPVRYMADAAKYNDHLEVVIVPTACVPGALMDLDYAILKLMLRGYDANIKEFEKELIDERDAIRHKWHPGSIWHAFLDALDMDNERDEARRRERELNETYIPLYKKMGEYMRRISEYIDGYKLGTCYRVEFKKQ